MSDTNDPDIAMAASVMGSVLRSLIKGEHSSIHLSFNDHAASYMTAREAIDQDDYSHGDWVSADEKHKAGEANSIWCLQWYPQTPVGFCCLLASSLEAVVAAALDENWQPFETRE